MAIAPATSGSLSNIWNDHRLSHVLKLWTYQLSVFSTLTHSSEAWTLTAAVSCSINSFDSRCLHVITGRDYRDTATAPRAIRQRRLRYLGHVLHMSESRVVRRSFVHSFVHPFIRSSVRPFVRPSVHPSIRSFVHSFIRSLVHSFIRSFVHSFTRFVHSFIRSCIHSLFHSFIHAFIHSFTH